MPRAIGSFRKADVEVEPWPVYDLTRLAAHRCRSPRTARTVRLLGAGQDKRAVPELTNRRLSSGNRSMGAAWVHHRAGQTRSSP
jgi:hypothetical protein